MKSTDMDAGELGSEGPISIMMLCIDTWIQKHCPSCIFDLAPGCRGPWLQTAGLTLVSLVGTSKALLL